MGACSPDAPHARSSTSSLLWSRATRKQELRRGLLWPRGCAGRAEGRAAPEIVVHRLRCDVNVAGALRADVGADVRTIGDHRVGGAVQMSQGQVAERMRRAARMRPQRGPQDQRHSGRARAQPISPAARRVPLCGISPRDNSHSQRAPADRADAHVGAGTADHRSDQHERSRRERRGGDPVQVSALQLRRPRTARTRHPRSHANAANAPTRSGGACPATNRTGFIATRACRRRVSARHSAPR